MNKLNTDKEKCDGGLQCKCDQPNRLNRVKTLKSIPSFILTALFAFFPKCPLCWMAYMSLFGSLGLSNIPYKPWYLIVLIILMVLHTGVLFYKAYRQKRYGPFKISLLGFVSIIVWKFLLPWQGLLVFGFICLLVGTLWNALSPDWLKTKLVFLNKKISV